MEIPEPTSLLLYSQEPKLIKVLQGVGVSGGFLLEVARTNDQFEASLDEGLPDLLLVHAQGQVLDECLGNLRVRPRGAQVPVILLCMEGDEAPMEASLSRGMSDVLVWPFTSKDALVRVQVNLRWSRLLSSTLSGAMDVRQAEDIKRNFLSVITHELRTPLAKILGLSDNIVAGVYGEPAVELARAAENIKVEASRLNQLFNQIIDLSKMTAGDLKMERTLCRVDEIVREILAPIKEAGRVRVQGDGATAVWIDRRMVEQLFSHMISNALKFSSGPVDVEFSIRKDTLGAGRFGEGFAPMGLRLMPGKEYLAIEVADTGEGVEASKLPLIFEKFTQADSSSTRRVTGMGIGLSLVKEIVAVHGGKLLMSSHPGKGTSMMVALPLDLRH